MCVVCCVGECVCVICCVGGVWESGVLYESICVCSMLCVCVVCMCLQILTLDALSPSPAG